jgi:hypothetical protein
MDLWSFVSYLDLMLQSIVNISQIFPLVFIHFLLNFSRSSFHPSAVCISNPLATFYMLKSTPCLTIPIHSTFKYILLTLKLIPWILTLTPCTLKPILNTLKPIFSPMRFYWYSFVTLIFHHYVSDIFIAN